MFRDRTDAGRQLAQVLAAKSLPDPVVLALPRGGVPVASEVARVLKAPLDLLLVRKIGAPFQRELAVAAVAEGGALAINEDVLDAVGVDRGYVERQAQAEVNEIARRRTLYVGSRAAVPVEGRSAIVIDDGIATGATMRAALRLLHERKPARIVLAVPVAPPDCIESMRALVDDLVCLQTPPHFHAVGAHYVEFDQVDDETVRRLLADAAART
jgi:putative phosphoribosyl transferase